ncbi:uncharacterized protein [Diadema antillarum]|uniref:uncharacterized protein n=1 Tax=Diadema antillarum TaxID=105358 RepID=UPI003A88F2B3
MSRRSTRSNSSGLKRKILQEEDSKSVPEEQEPSKKSSKVDGEVYTYMLLKKEEKCDAAEEAVPAPGMSEHNNENQSQEPAEDKSQPRETEKVSAGPRVGYIDAVRKAVAAKRKLDQAVRSQRSAINFKKMVRLVRKDLTSHMKLLDRKLKACQKYNKHLEALVQEVFTTLYQQVKGPTMCPCSTRKKSRPKTTVISVPEQGEESHHIITAKKEERTDSVEEPSNKQSTSDLEQTLVVDQKEDSDSSKPPHNLAGDFTFITLNTEEDYPGGSWLGDESNPQMRVRCHIPPSDMLHIMNMYKSADKLALKLLDLLFDKETQATSNLSGTGKHKKKKLDPLFVFGIHCHLMKHFAITGEDWYRIRLNIDSKCRTAFRRKQKGLALYPKHAVKNKRVPVSIAGTTYKTQDFPHSSTVQHLQQVVSQLQSIPAEGLSGIAIIREQPDGTSTVETASGSLVGHTILQEGGELQADQLKEVINQAGSTSEIHLAAGQTIGFSQSGELEIREIHVEEAKEEQ